MIDLNLLPVDGLTFSQKFHWILLMNKAMIIMADHKLWIINLVIQNHSPCISISVNLQFYHLIFAASSLSFLLEKAMIIMADHGSG